MILLKINIFNLLAVGFGGALGSGSRYQISLWIHEVEPLATLIVNILGSFLFAVLLGLLINRSLKSYTKLFIGTGFFGGFTTMSTVAFDMAGFTQNGEVFLLILYLFFTLSGGLIAAFLGFFTGRRMVPWFKS